MFRLFDVTGFPVQMGLSIAFRKPRWLGRQAGYKHDHWAVTLSDATLGPYHLNGPGGRIPFNTGELYQVPGTFWVYVGRDCLDGASHSAHFMPVGTELLRVAYYNSAQKLVGIHVHTSNGYRNVVEGV